MRLALILSLSGCGAGDIQHSGDNGVYNAAELPNKAHYQVLAEDLGKEPVSFKIEGHSAVMRGILDSSLPDLISNLFKVHPEVDTIIMEEIKGTVDLLATYEAGSIMREACITTVVPYKGFVASGGVSLFLAGCERIADESSSIVVHTWRNFTLDDNGEKVVKVAAIDLPVTDSAHDVHLDYLDEMGIPEEFYWFTINTPFETPHYLSNEELETYNIVTQTNETWGAKYRPVVETIEDVHWKQARLFLDGDTVIIHGKIGPDTATQLHELLRLHPEVQTIEFGIVPGTTKVNTYYAIDTGKVIHDFCLTSKTNAESIVSGDAVDTLISGCSFNLDSETKFGIVSPIDRNYIEFNSDLYQIQKLQKSYRQYFQDIGADTRLLDFQLSQQNSDKPNFINSKQLAEFGII